MRNYVIYYFAFVLSMFLFSCGSKTTTQTNESSEQLQSENIQSATTCSINPGKYVYEPENWEEQAFTLDLAKDGINYTGSIEVTGKQVFYKISVTCIATENKIDLLFDKVLDGVFYQESTMKQGEVLFSLRNKGGSILTDWANLDCEDNVKSKSGGEIFIMK